MIPSHERLDEFGFEIWEENPFPLAYLLTFRTFGTWLHGDERTSVKRDGWNVYGRARVASNDRMERWMLEEMKQPPFVLNTPMRSVVEASVRELYERRGYGLGAVNVRTNHVHAVVSAALKPERIVDALKANARQNFLGTPDWSILKLEYGHEAAAGVICGSHGTFMPR